MTNQIQTANNDIFVKANKVKIIFAVCPKLIVTDLVGLALCVKPGVSALGAAHARVRGQKNKVFTTNTTVQL